MTEPQFTSFLACTLTPLGQLTMESALVETAPLKFLTRQLRLLHSLDHINCNAKAPVDCLDGQSPPVDYNDIVVSSSRKTLLIARKANV